MSLLGLLEGSGPLRGDCGAAKVTTGSGGGGGGLPARASGIQIATCDPPVVRRRRCGRRQTYCLCGNAAPEKRQWRPASPGAENSFLGTGEKKKEERLGALLVEVCEGPNAAKQRV